MSAFPGIATALEYITPVRFFLEVKSLMQVCLQKASSYYEEMVHFMKTSLFNTIHRKLPESLR
jgi:hypothetical protein